MNTYLYYSAALPTGYNMNDPSQVHLLSRQLEKVKRFINESDLPEDSMETDCGLDSASMLRAPLRPLEITYKRDLPWYLCFIQRMKQGLYPPLYIIEQIAHLRIVASTIYRENREEINNDSTLHRLATYFPGLRENPVPNLIGNYLLCAKNRYKTHGDSRHSGLLRFRDQAPAFVKCLVFHMVFNLVFLIRAQLLKKEWFADYPEILGMVGFFTRRYSRPRTFVQSLPIYEEEETETETEEEKE
jgi:hypothetical protein